jgi:hypothetical protein
MGTILPFHLIAIDQPEVSFMDQGRGLEAMAGSFAPHVVMRKTAEFGVNDGDQAFERIQITATPGA